MFEPYLTDGGRTFVFAASWRGGVEHALSNVHQSDQCVGHHCVIHDPSDHCMRTWPLHWRYDRMIFERICPHGVGHPDPDSLFYEEQQDPAGEFVGSHGCDGCCRLPCGNRFEDES
jgi:hypothetical protein